MPANKQNDPNFFNGAGINEIEYDILGNPTGVMPVRPISQTQSTPPNTAGTAGKIPATGNPASAASQKGIGAATDDNVTPHDQN
jgi:hypothetical protein